MLQEINNIETDIEREEYNRERNKIKDTLKNILTEEQAEAELNILDRIITNGALTFGEEPMARVNFLKQNPLNLEYINRSINPDNGLFQSAAMYKAPQENITEFVDDVLNNNLEKKKYYSINTHNNNEIRLSSDIIRHDTNEHNLTKNDWENIINNIDNVKDIKYSYRQTNYGKDNLLLEIETEQGNYGVVIAVNNNSNFITTAFKKENINLWNDWWNKASSNVLAETFTPNGNFKELQAQPFLLDNAIIALKNKNVNSQIAPHRGIATKSLTLKIIHINYGYVNNHSLYE